MIKTFDPIYGWGWRNKLGELLEVPDELLAEVALSSETSCSGTVIKPDAYANWRVQISRRADGGDIWYYNVILTSADDKEKVTGFAQGSPFIDHN